MVFDLTLHNLYCAHQNTKNDIKKRSIQCAGFMNHNVIHNNLQVNGLHYTTFLLKCHLIMVFDLALHYLFRAPETTSREKQHPTYRSKKFIRCGMIEASNMVQIYLSEFCVE